MKKNKWLAISIFTAKNNWSSLLKNGIHPLIDLLFNNKDIISFYLQFNDVKSEHIRLALLVPGNLTNKVAPKTDRYFKDLFKDNELSPVSTNDASNGIFVPYLKNVVHYDLYSTSLLPVSGDLLSLQEAFSWSMLDAFSDSVIDDDLILTFCLHVLFSCYKVLPESERLLYAREMVNLDKASDDFIGDNYNDLHTSILDVYNDVMVPSTENTLEWLTKWEHIFKKIYTAACDSNDELICLISTINIIYQQLGLSNLSIILLNRLVLKTLSE